MEKGQAALFKRCLTPIMITIESSITD